VKLEIDRSLPPIRADSDRLQQVLNNLLTNALRHTAQGTITISAAVSQKDGKNVGIAITDTGEGIATEDFPHVFDRFYRGDKARSRASGGIGLGLSIARTWIKLMGGEIGVESATGQGARFWFELPQTSAIKKF
jgi:signal transduction histidine kinase